MPAGENATPAGRQKVRGPATLARRIALASAEITFGVKRAYLQ